MEEESRTESSIDQAFAIHLLDIIKRFNQACRDGEYVIMAQECQFLYEELNSNILESDRENHNKINDSINDYLEKITIAKNKQVNKKEDRSLFKLPQESHGLFSLQRELIELLKKWKIELMLIMDKNEMLMKKKKFYNGEML